jgi:phage terminase small subunit
VTHRRACRRLVAEDVIIDGLHGPVRNPVVAQARDAANLVRALAQEFGLTPSGRSRIDVGVRSRDSDENNPFAG